MPVPVLGVYEYQFKDNGIKLNGAAAPPFVDVEKVTGLDMAEVDVSEHDVDGAHGGTVYGTFFKVRTVVIEGTIYAASNSIDSYIDALISNYLPAATPSPFYFRGEGVGTRFLYCYSVGIRFDVDRLRSTGSCKVQIQLKAADPIKYAEHVASPNNNTYTTVNNIGNMVTYPIFKLQGGTYTDITLRNNTTAKELSITRNFTLSDILEINFNTKMVYLNGNRHSSILGAGAVNWWGIIPGNNQIRFSATGTTPPTGEIIWRSGWA